MEASGSQQSSSLATDLITDRGQVLGFNLFQCSYASVLRLIVLLEGEPLPCSHSSLESTADWDTISSRVVLHLAPSVVTLGPNQFSSLC